MRARFGVRLGAVVAGLLMVVLIGPACLSARAKKKSAPPEQFCSLSVVVLRDFDGTPIKNAEVVIHFLRVDGSQSSEGFELKTDREGRASIDDIPFGRLRLQVVAHKMQTYGDDVEIREAKQEFVIRLKAPVGQE